MNETKKMPWRKRTLAGLAIWSAAFGFGYFGYSWSQDRQFAFAEQQRTELRQGLPQIADLSMAFRQVSKVVEPAVVKLEVKKKVLAGQHAPIDPDMLKRLFPDRDGDGEPDLPEGLRAPFDDDFDAAGTGSGVIMEVGDGKGYILTNNHVAGGADEITVFLADGREIKNGRILGADPKTDLALVEIKADRLSPAVWGNSDELQKGDFILAFGAPFGYVGSMTHGIVSALNRQAGILAGIGGYENFIQVDAPINPGNSGGPLVNLRGEVVGINTAIASRSGGFQGLGFAIPANQAKLIYSQLREKGKVIRGYLGVGIRDVARDPALARSFGYEQDHGVLVEQLVDGTPAMGKLQAGDIVTAIDGKEVRNMHELRARIANMPPGQEVKLTVFRDKKTSDVTIKLAEQPADLRLARAPGKGGLDKDPPAAAAPLSSLGITVQTVTEELAKRQNLDAISGALITRVDRNSPAASEGLRPGDVVTMVGNTKVTTAEDLTRALEKADLKKGVRLYISAREGERFVFLSTEKK